MFYLLLFLIPVFTVTIIFTFKDLPKYEIIAKEIQPKGEYFLLVKTEKYDSFNYENINVSHETFDKFTRGKISSRDYKEIKRGD